VVGEGLADVAEPADLLGVERVEQRAPYGLDVSRRGDGQGGEALVGEDGDLTALVGRAVLPAHPAALLQPRDRVGIQKDPLMSRRIPPPVVDVALLVARVAIGVVFVAHGWQKFHNGLTATGHAFKAMGVPAPTLSAYDATFVGLGAGILLILGLLTPIAGVLLFLDLVGAFLTVRVDKGGYEFVLTLAAVTLALAVVRAGRISADGLFSGGRTSANAACPASRDVSFRRLRPRCGRRPKRYVNCDVG
jgi:putative oxidoreductase